MYQLLEGHGVVPVIKFNDPSEALPLADALAAGGIKIMEITFRSAARWGHQTGRNRASGHPGGCRYGGEHGAVGTGDSSRFQICGQPGFDEEIVKAGLQQGIIMLPGVITPTEIMAALKAGLSILKFFRRPYSVVCRQSKPMPASFRRLNLCRPEAFRPEPTDSWRFPTFSLRRFLDGERDLISGQKWDEVTALSAEATAIYQKVRG